MAHVSRLYRTQLESPLAGGAAEWWQCRASRLSAIKNLSMTRDGAPSRRGAPHARHLDRSRLRIRSRKPPNQCKESLDQEIDGFLRLRAGAAAHCAASAESFLTETKQKRKLTVMPSLPIAHLDTLAAPTRIAIDNSSNTLDLCVAPKTPKDGRRIKSPSIVYAWQRPNGLLSRHFPLILIAAEYVCLSLKVIRTMFPFWRITRMSLC